MFSCFVAAYILLFRMQHPQNRGGGVFNCLSGAKKLQFLTKKRPFLAEFFMKNGRFWYIQMLQIVFQSSVFPYNLLFPIQHPQKRGGVFECLSGAGKLNLSPKNGHSWPFFFMKNDKCWCIRMLSIVFS